MKKNINVEFVRVISIMMVIIIHVSSYILLNVYAFKEFLYFQAFFKVGVSCFFLLMGYVFNTNKNLITMWKKSICRFIIPIIFFSLFYDLFYNFLTYKSSFMTCYSNIKLNYDLIKRVFLNNVLFTKAFHFWYLYDILKLYLLYPLLKIVCKPQNVKLKKFLIIILFIVYIIFPSIINLYKPLFFLNKFFNYNLGYICLYFLIGNYLKDNMLKIKINKFILFILYLIMIFLCIVCFSKIEIFYNKPWLYLYSFNYSFIFMFFASIFFFIFLFNIKIKYKDIILFLGDKTLIVYYIHIAILYLYVYNPNIRNLFYSYTYIRTIIMTLVIYMSCIFVATLFKNIIYKFFNFLIKKLKKQNI